MIDKDKTVEQFCSIVKKIVRSDRDCFIVCSGFTGEGKSTLTALISNVLAKNLRTKFTFENNMTMNRQTFVEMIDGDNQLKEYSIILIDEIISLFNKRNWMRKNQKSALELLDKCRDRHLTIIGNVPTFWAIDNMLINNKVRFWIHVPKRGFAWLFEPDKNPFSSDRWNRKVNEKLFEKYGIEGLLKSRNFRGTIIFNDLDKETKKEYLKIRNEMRKNTESQDDEPAVEGYKKPKLQRDNLIRALQDKTDMTQGEIAELAGLERTHVNKIINGRA